MGMIKSAAESPSQVTLSALPRFKLKYLDMLVVAVCDIKPWPESLKKKMGVKTIINLRGENGLSAYSFEKETCERIMFKMAGLQKMSFVMLSELIEC